jgi:hypothetical protein
VTSKARERLKRERMKIREFWALQAGKFALMNPEAYTQILEGPPPYTGTRGRSPMLIHDAFKYELKFAYNEAAARRLHRAIWLMAGRTPSWR